MELTIFKATEHFHLIHGAVSQPSVTSLARNKKQSNINQQEV
jgi:hypothetical protein